MKGHRAKPKKQGVKSQILQIFCVIFLFIICMFILKRAFSFHPQVQYVSINHATLAYYTRGQGDPMVLLPDSAMTMQEWDPLLLQQLSKRHQLIIFDYRGVGLSQTDTLSSITSSQLASDVITLMNTLGIKKADVLGWSLGSFVGQVVAENYPDRVNKLILVATASGKNQMEQPVATTSAKNLDHTSNGNWEVSYLPLMFPQDARSEENAYVQRVTLAKQTGEAPKEQRQTQHVIGAFVNAFSDPKEEQMRYANLAKISTKTLILAGTKDTQLPIAKDKIVALKIPHSQLVLLPDAGHAVLFQDTNQSVDLINAFLNQ